MKKVNLVAVAVAAALAASPALAVDFNGYFRAGTGISGNSGSDVAVNKAGIGRLGNENDNYYEFGFSEELETGEQTWRVESMLNKGDTGQSGSEDGDINVAQFAVKAKGLIASDKEATLWAGKTYYQRKDIHITDFYFLNTSGTGGGIENLSLGNQKLSAALIQDGENDNGAGYILDTRLANIGVWEDAYLELALAYNFSNEKDGKNIDADDGLLASAILHQNMKAGFNQTVLQYGTNGYGSQVASFGSGAYYNRANNAQNEASGYRLLNWGVVSLGSDWEMGHQLAFMVGSDIGGTDTNDNATSFKSDTDQFSVVVRPMYKWDDTMRTIFEAGVNMGEKINSAGTAKEDFGNTKFTVAQGWAMGNDFWARPELRVYGSYITDTENDNAFGTGEDSEYVVGIQVEAWW